MRSLRRALLWASVAGISIGCSVNQSGLTDGGDPHADGSGGASGGSPGGRGGTAGGTGGVATGVAGNSAGASGGSVAGASGVSGAGGMAAGAAGSGGSGATGGAGNSAGTGGSAIGSGGTGNPGIGGSGGSVGSGGSGGSAGSGGSIAGSSGATGGSIAGSSGGAGTGGNGASGGRGGTVGSGGAGATGTAGTGSGGRGGLGGRGGGGPGGRGGFGGNNNPCSGYPAAKPFVPPNDTRVHCYWARTSSQTWSEAQQACNLQNGYLVSILSAEENAFVVSVAVFSPAFSDTWIGATDGRSGGDRNGPGTYRWVSNETWGYTSWAMGQPDGFCDPCSAGQTCTCDHRAVLSSDGTWNDRWQDNNRSSVCEAVPN